MNELWKTWNEVKKICKDKKSIFFYGRSEDWVPKTLPKFVDLDNIFIIDQNPSYLNTKFCGLDVLSPDYLKNENKEEIYIIITAGPYESVSEDLIDNNFIPGIHFCCTPEIRDWALLQEIRDYEREVIISCSDYSEKSKKRHSKAGGGLYLCNTKENSFIKKASGHFRQLVEVDKYYYVVEFVEKKIYVFNKNFEILEKYDIDQSKDLSDKPNSCGIAYDKSNDMFFVANSGSDEISIFDRQGFKYLDRISFSDKYEMYGDGQHHINDITIVDNSLFISYFSFNGSWKKGGMDGGVSEILIDNQNLGPQPIFHDLCMPHSPEIIDGQICVLDSMNGKLWVGNKRVEATLPGFARGLTYDNRFYFIGQSEDMYMSRLFGIKNNIMCNAGMYLFDLSTKVSRFYSFPDIMNIHDLHIYK